jgi:protein-S-isoprenylcysteine O-methyltransferase Ste14
MKTEMTLGGIGPKLMLMCLPYVLLSLAVMQRDPEFLDIRFLAQGYYKSAGILWLAAGLIFWAASAVTFLRNFGSGKLITTGIYGLCRNPIYASIIVFVLPALSLIYHSGLILSIDLVLYIGFKISIHGEVNLLKRKFGETYADYEKSVNELVPFPRFWFGKKN